MDKLNLVLKFKLAGDSGLRVKGASRIKVDGRGGLVVYDAENGTAEEIDLRALQAFSVQRVSCARFEAPVLAA